jgi:hypothetical protein
MLVGRNRTAILLSGFLLAGLASAGIWLIRQTRPEECVFCRRPIHVRARAEVLVDNRRQSACCVRCALTEARQTGKPIRLLEVTDYATNKTLAPESAYFVEGGRVVLCEPHDHDVLDEAKRPVGRVFDRCEPSAYAFARREDAEAFRRDNGGVLLRWQDVLKEAGARP